jgi:IclR family KDG regulon transcriptional repressor
MDQKGRYNINSVLRALQVLQAFSFDKPTYTNSELSKKLGLPKATLTRLLSSIQTAGFLSRDSKTGEYRLTHRIYRIGCVYLNQLNFYSEARPLLAGLSAVTQETVHLVIFDGRNILYLDKVESPHSISMKSRSGLNFPAYSTASGKVLLADLDASRLEDYLNSVELVPFTPNTITEPEKLRRCLTRVRDQGYAIDDVENEADVKCIAAPVRDTTGRSLAAVSVSAPIYRMNKASTERKIIAALLKTAQTLSKQLGYIGAQ